MTFGTEECRSKQNAELTDSKQDFQRASLGGPKLIKNRGILARYDCYTTYYAYTYTYRTVPYSTLLHTYCTPTAQRREGRMYVLYQHNTTQHPPHHTTGP